MLYLWLGARRPTAQLYDSISVSQYYLGWPLCLLRGNSASENLPCEAQRPKCCLYKTPYYVAAPVRETGDVIARTLLYVQLPTYAPTITRFFFWFTSNAFLQRPVLSKYWLLRPFSTRKPYAKAVPSKDYFMHLRTLKNVRKGCWVIGPNYRVSHPRHFWAIGDNSCSKIWCPSGLTLIRMPYDRGTLRIPLQRILYQGKPTLLLWAKREEPDNQPHSWLEIPWPWWFHTQAVLRSFAGLMSRKKVSVWGFLWIRKVWFAFAQWTFAPETFGKRQKASCFEKPTHSVPEIWGRMYKVLPRIAKGTRNGMRNQIPVQPRKGAKKLVRSDFAKILEYESSD